MPRQNRVTPTGEIIATPARGLFFGNRGCLHNVRGEIRRAFRGERWILCQLDFKGRKRKLLQPGRYTELFFLDEATALAAGHRPCAECMHSRYTHFLATWAAGNPGQGGEPLRAPILDAELQRQRIDAQGKQRTWRSALHTLPAGVIVRRDAASFCELWHGKRLLRWTPYGYTDPWRPSVSHCVSHCVSQNVDVLTPRASVSALASGYDPVLHATAGCSSICTQI